MADVRLRDLNPAEFNYGVNVAGSLGVGTTSPNAKVEIVSDGSDSAGAEIRLQHANNIATDIVSTVNFANSVGSVAMIQGGTTSGNTNGYISFHTDTGGTSVERMRILSNGYVGMGTGASVLARLHVRGNSDTSDHDCAIRIVDADGTSGSTIPNLQFWTDSQQIYQIRANDTMGLQFRNASDANKITFDPDGKVGIGETEPANFLHVNSAGTQTVANFTSTSSAAKIQFNNSGGNSCFVGSSGTRLFLSTDSTERIGIYNNGNVAIGNVSSVAAKLHVEYGVAGTSTVEVARFLKGAVNGGGEITLGTNVVIGGIEANNDVASGGSLRFSTLTSGGARTEKVRITNDGKMGINLGGAVPEETLHVNGNLKVTGTVDVGSSGFSVSSGFILPFGGGTAPSGWLECNGQAVSRSTYSDLFAIVGTIYGAGDGSTTFNVPDLQGRVIMGEGGNTAGRTPAALESIGDTSGEQSVILNVNQLPAHNHSGRGSVNRGAYRDDGDTPARGQGLSPTSYFRGSVGINVTVDNTGGNAPINNIQPSIVIMYLIKT